MVVVKLAHVQKSLVALAAVLIVLPTAHAGTGGGTISNVAAEAVSLANDAATVNQGHKDTLTGTVKDMNKITDLISITLSVTDPDSTQTDDTATLAGVSIPAADPGSKNVGDWTVWDGTPNDGILHFRFEPTWSYGLAGDHTWTLTAADEKGAGATIKQIVVTVVEKIKTYPHTVADDGSEANTTWGGWSAVPSDAATDNVESKTWLKVENTGATAEQPFVVDFGGDFTMSGGTTDIGGGTNLELAVVFDPAGNLGDETLTWTAADGGGAGTFTFPATGSIAYVKYRIIDMPSLLEDGIYSASFTVNAT